MTHAKPFIQSLAKIIATEARKLGTRPTARACSLAPSAMHQFLNDPEAMRATTLDLILEKALENTSSMKLILRSINELTATRFAGYEPATGKTAETSLKRAIRSVKRPTKSIIDKQIQQQAKRLHAIARTHDIRKQRRSPAKQPPLSTKRTK